MCGKKSQSPSYPKTYILPIPLPQSNDGYFFKVIFPWLLCIYVQANIFLMKISQCIQLVLYCVSWFYKCPLDTFHWLNINKSIVYWTCHHGPFMPVISISFSLLAINFCLALLRMRVKFAIHMLQTYSSNLFFRIYEGCYLVSQLFYESESKGKKSRQGLRNS